MEASGIDPDPQPAVISGNTVARVNVKRTQQGHTWPKFIPPRNGLGLWPVSMWDAVMLAGEFYTGS